MFTPWVIARCSSFDSGACWAGQLWLLTIDVLVGCLYTTMRIMRFIPAFHWIGRIYPRHIRNVLSFLSNVMGSGPCRLDRRGMETITLNTDHVANWGVQFLHGIVITRKKPIHSSHQETNPSQALGEIFREATQDDRQDSIFLKRHLCVG